MDGKSECCLGVSNQYCLYVTHSRYLVRNPNGKGNPLFNAVHFVNKNNGLGVALCYILEKWINSVLMGCHILTLSACRGSPKAVCADGDKSLNITLAIVTSRIST